MSHVGGAMAGAKRAARGRAEREERAGYAGSGAGSNRAGRAKSRIRDAGNAVRSLVSTRTGDDMEDWVVFGVSFWWYPVWYSLTTVILGFLGTQAGVDEALLGNDGWHQFHDWWRIVDYVWWAINVLELVVRATSHRRRFWITQRADGGWSFHVRNIVGVAVLAAAALFSVAVRLDGFFFIIGSLRLPMVLAYVPGLSSVVEAFRRCWRRLLLAFIPLFGLMYWFGTMGFLLFGKSCNNPLTGTVDPTLCGGWDYFGSLGNAMWTLLQVATMDSWSSDVARPLMELRGAWTFVFFLLYILLFGFVLFNIFTGIIVDAISQQSAVEEEAMGNDGAAAAVAFGTERGAPALHPPAVPGEGVEMKTVPPGRDKHEVVNPVFAHDARTASSNDAAVVAAIEQLGVRMAAMQEVLLRKLDRVDARVKALEARRLH